MRKNRLLRALAAVTMGLAVIASTVIAPVGDSAKVHAATTNVEAAFGGDTSIDIASISVNNGDSITVRVTNNHASEAIESFTINKGGVTCDVSGFDAFSVDPAGSNRTFTLSNITTSGTVVVTFYRADDPATPYTITIPVQVQAAPGPGGVPGGAGEPNGDGGRVIPVHSHDGDCGEWTTFGNEDDPNGGYEEYRCGICGEVLEVRWINAYYIFNRKTADKIKKAPYGATVKAETDRWVSYHKMVFDELAKRPDVTLVTDYVSDHVKYEMTIPAGKSGTPGALDENGYAGYRRISSIFPTTLR